MNRDARSTKHKKGKGVKCIARSFKIWWWHGIWRLRRPGERQDEFKILSGKFEGNILWKTVKVCHRSRFNWLRI
jgi:hypothetical protein